MDDFMYYFPKIMPVLIIIALICAVIVGLILGGGAIKRKKSPVLNRHGKVIEKIPGTYDRIVVEFDNGDRQSLVDLKRKEIFAVGDTGTFQTQINAIISFERD